MISAAAETIQSNTSGSTSGFIWLPGNRELAEKAMQRLQGAHKTAVDIDDPLIPESALPAVARALQLARVTAISCRTDLHPSTINGIKRVVGDGWIEQEEGIQRWLEEQE